MSIFDPEIMGKKKGSSTMASQAANLDIDLLAFDETALTALTEKIEKGFGKDKEAQTTADISNGREKAKRKKKGKEVKARDAPSSSKAQPVRGTKRDHQGHTKETAPETPKSENGPRKQRDGRGNHDRDVLLQEILALGGTEEDLDLVADAATDEEDESIRNNGPVPAKSLEKELANFVASLGINGEIAADFNKADEMDEEYERVEKESEKESSQPDEPIKTANAAKFSKIASEDNSSSQVPGRLVSFALQLRCHCTN